MKRILSSAILGAVLSILLPGGAFAHEGHKHAAHAGMSDGVILKIDKVGGWVKLEHGPIANLDMAAMTMTFKARKPEMLAPFKEGDRVHFRADNVKGALTIVRIEAAK